MNHKQLPSGQYVSRLYSNICHAINKLAATTRACRRIPIVLKFFLSKSKLCARSPSSFAFASKVDNGTICELHEY